MNSLPDLIKLVNEKPIPLRVAARRLGVGITYACALKRKLGSEGHLMFLSDAIRFAKANPEFREADVWRANQPNPRVKRNMLPKVLR